MENKIGKAGIAGPKVQSDCFVQWRFRETGGLQFTLKSRVSRLYGDSITKLVHQIFHYYDIKNAQIELVDKGAIPWVLMARLEASIKKLVKTNRDFLPESGGYVLNTNNSENKHASVLTLASNTPGQFLHAGLYQPDIILFDLESNIPDEQKLDARLLVRNALLAWDFSKAEIWVRMNLSNEGLLDLETLIPLGVKTFISPDTTVINKLQTKESIQIIPIIKELNELKNIEIADFNSGFSKLIMVESEVISKLPNQELALFLKKFQQAGTKAISPALTNFTNTDTLLVEMENYRKLGFTFLRGIHPLQIPVFQKSLEN